MSENYLIFERKAHSVVYFVQAASVSEAMWHYIQEHNNKAVLQEDGPSRVIADCRKQFTQSFPRSRAKAFIWYMRQGVLATFYRKQRPLNYVVLKRYFWSWADGRLAVEEWEGGYDQILANLLLEPPRQ